ncbi:MAG: hypothetical protein WC965_01140 [Thiohalomonadaceae bacterium]
MKSDIWALEKVLDILEEARSKLQKVELPPPPSGARDFADYVGDLLLDLSEQATELVLETEFYNE